MKPQKIVIIAGVLIGIILLGSFLLLRKNSALTEQEAIAVVKQKYPALQDYPSNDLPARLISTAQSDDKWYIAFIQSGSGRPILDARCFIVNLDHSVIENGIFAPKPDNAAQTISPITCKEQ